MPPITATQPRLDVEIPTIYIKGICYGFVRFRLGKSIGRDQDWHCWTLFLHSNCGLDLSPFIEKVSFVIHPDFSQNIRAVYEPPYEITVLGQTGFDARLHVFYRDSSLPPSILHVRIIIDGERYSRRIFPDMLIFIKPKLWFAHLLDIERIAQRQSTILHHLSMTQFLWHQNARGRLPFIYSADTRTTNTRKVMAEGLMRKGTGRLIAHMTPQELEGTYPPFSMDHDISTVGAYLFDPHSPVDTLESIRDLQTRIDELCKTLQSLKQP
ncbi:YEATS family protein [Giardia muris]|uniref:YEATS family protein n=1 Tax=Giardia muris TaxID=5742 RepID=A0A4Z1SU98_GIAMU|nr:YEATS family protein [Giardia muris]|eukprot:TNJ29424.1 YEATS family protein [Giardia muris]